MNLYIKKTRQGFVRLHILPLLVWLVAIGVVTTLFYNRTQRFEVVGIAQGELQQIRALVDGRLKVVPVGLFEKVTKGQILAVLDDAHLNAQIETIQAEMDHLMAQLLSTQDTMLAEAANRQTDTTASQRRFFIDVENARVRILELRTLIETDKVTLQDLALEMDIATELLKKEAIAPYELQKAEAVHDVLAKKIDETEDLLAQTARDLEQALQRRNQYVQHQPANPSVDSVLETIRKQITVQEKLIAELTTQREALTITSPVDGVVIQIQVDQAASRRPGEDVLRKAEEVVMAGDPILVIAKSRSTEIVTYIDEQRLAQVKEKTTVQLIKNSHPPQIAQSQVARLGPTMELMPQRLWRNPNIAQWGRPILIKVPSALKLLPGETVGIKGL